MQRNREQLERWNAPAGIGWPCCVLMAAALLATGCGGSKPSGGSNPATPAQYNNYAGTQTYELFPDGYDETGGVWNLTLDDANQFFTYTDVSIPPVNFGGAKPPYPIEGSVKSASGFLNLTLNGKAAGSGGYAIEIPGRAAIFRPGNDSTFPVVSVAASTSGCQGLAQQTTFEFLTLPPVLYSQAPAYAAYGSLQASTSGATWSFSNLQMFTLDGTALNPSTPASGLCAYTKEGYVTNIIPSKETGNLPWTVAVGPSGYLIVDQGQGNGPTYQGPVPNQFGPFGLVGFPQPSSRIDTGSLAGASYIGFAYEAYGLAVSHPVTQPLAFTGGSGTVAIGGLYPNDDVTQTPPRNITMDLGREDSKTNGLYPSVTVTMPDTYKGCVLQSYGGTDPDGNPTCIAHGIAIAGSIEGKYVLYVSLNDRSLETRGITGAVLAYFLYQQ